MGGGIYNPWKDVCQGLLLKSTLLRLLVFYCLTRYKSQMKLFQ